MFHASVPEPDATDPTALAALRATLRRPWLPPERFVDLMLRINADTPEMLVAALATPDPSLQKLLSSQLAWRVEKIRCGTCLRGSMWTGGRGEAWIFKPPSG